MEKCGIGCYVWGTKLPVMIDILVLGDSLKRHKNKAETFLCINDDTRECRLSNLFQAFWKPVPVSHVCLPSHLEGSEMKRLQGVYSKLQVFDIFAKKPHQLARFLLMDGDMLVRTNIDDLFTTNTPAAVMRGDCDTCLYERRPGASYFFGGSSTSFTHDKQKMKGGINGGLLLVEPDENTYNDMYKALKKFKPNTSMAEQEFLSYYWGVDGQVWAMHKRNNFQLHQLYLTLPKPPPGQTRESAVKYMIETPDEISVFHFSADLKPSQMLVNDLPCVQGWLELNKHLKVHTEYMMSTHGTRNPDLQKYPEWMKRIQKLDEDAHREWFGAWKHTWLNMITYVLQQAFRGVIKVSTKKQDLHDHVSYQCEACSYTWLMTNDEHDTNVIRDHLLFHCPEMARSVRIPLQHATNLTTFFFIPCGAQVENKMVYLSEVLHYYERKWGWSMRTSSLPLNPEVQPQILLPAYTIPKHVLAITEDEGIDAADALPDEAECTLRAVKRRYERAMDTSRKHDIYAWKTNKDVAKTWENTLMTAAKSASWLMKHEEPLLQDEAKKTFRASGPSSSSTGMPSVPINPCVPPPPPQKQLVPPAPPPPATKSKARPKQFVSTTLVPKQPKHPPPPPPRRS